ncbi:hypothetical protein FKM82_030854 [Ascaphus truei]
MEGETLQRGEREVPRKDGRRNTAERRGGGTTERWKEKHCREERGWYHGKMEGETLLRGEGDVPRKDGRRNTAERRGGCTTERWKEKETAVRRKTRGGGEEEEEKAPRRLINSPHLAPKV